MITRFGYFSQEENILLYIIAPNHFFYNQEAGVLNFYDESNKNKFHVLNIYYQPGILLSNLNMLFLPTTI